MAIKMSREYRTIPLKLETRSEGEPDYHVRGYAATFAKYEIYRDMDDTAYYEQLDPHAFEGADMSDVIMLYNHEGMVHARQKNGTLQLSVDEHGLKVDADLSTTEASRQLYESIRSGLVDQMSYAFTVREGSYDVKTHTRTILKIEKLYDVSAVSIPANPDTDISAISARDYFHGVMEAEKAERLERGRKFALAQALYDYNSMTQEDRK